MFMHLKYAKGFHNYNKQHRGRRWQDKMRGAFRFVLIFSFVLLLYQDKRKNKYKLKTDFLIL